MKTKFFLCLPGLLLAVALVFGFAQDAAAQDSSDPPSRVAHLTYAEGSVSYQPYGEQDWLQADLDRPLTIGDNLWADQNSRAEVHVGSTAFRMGDQTGISFLNLNDQVVQVELAQGTLEVNVRHLDPDQSYEIDAPNLAFSIVRPGAYRLDSDPNGSSTVVTVYAGQGVVTGGGQTFNVTPEQRAIFTGTNQLSENVQGLPGPDAFYSWANEREYHEEHSMSARYLSMDEAGYEDLDDYGGWRHDSVYGDYWVPNNVGADWEPYHEGRWCWVAPWGWTWVDAEPWGFTPFHYGRWAMFGATWGWVPGPVAAAPVYAPALVGFVGGGGFGVAIQFGAGLGVGWFPLGPRDVYIPAYQASAQYVQQINISNTTVINRTTVVNVYNNYTVNHVTNVNYTYANNTRAVTVVNQQAFVGGRPVAQSAMRVNPSEIQNPRVVTTAALTPSRESVVGAESVARAKPPASLANRQVVTKMTPAARAEPIGRPRPSTNPSLTPAVLNRSGYSPQLQTVRATAAARAPAKSAAPAPAQPNRAPPNTNRPFTPPNRAASPRPTTPNQPAANPRTNEAPARPAPNRPPATNRPNEAPARRPFTPPNRPNTQPRPETPQPAAPPARPEEQPRRETPPPSTSRPAEPARPAEQPRPANPHTAPPANGQAPAKPKPKPQPKKPPKKPGEPGSQNPSQQFF
jgi:hypothetical protein